MKDMRYSEEDFFQKSKEMMKKISPIVIDIMDKDGVDGFVMAYYVLSRMRLDVIEGLRGLAGNKIDFENSIISIDNMLASDDDTIELRKKIEERLHK